MINGREVVKTRAISITPETFTASFANTEFAGFFVQLQTNPNDLKAELWEKCLGKEARMCSVVMEFPGMCAYGVKLCLLCEVVLIWRS